MYVLFHLHAVRCTYCLRRLYTVFTKKEQSQRIFSIILFRPEEIFFTKKVGRINPESTQDTTAVAFPTKLM